MSGQAGTIRKGRGKVCKFSSFFVVAGTIRKRRVLFPKVVSTVPLFKKPMFLAPAARNNRFFFWCPWQQWLESSPLLPGGGLIQAKARVGASGNLDEAHILKSVASVLITWC